MDERIARIHLIAWANSVGVNPCDIIAAGKEDGDHVIFPNFGFKELIKKHSKKHTLEKSDVRATPPIPSPPDLTVTELATNFAAAMGKWAGSGFKLASEDIYNARAAACAFCEHWDSSARLGLGKCGAPGCGCTKFKRWLLTERCPLKKWPDENAK